MSLNQHNSRNRWKAGACTLVVMAALAAAGWWGLHGGVSFADVRDRVPVEVASAQDLSVAFRHAAETVMPAVVTIRATGRSEITMLKGGKEQQGEIPEELSPLLRQFFGDDMPNLERRFELRSPQMPQTEGMGSGVIIDASGVILTNNHVAGGGSELLVTLHDGREFKASSVQTDPKSDIAIVRIEGAGDLPVATLGSSDELQIGDWVLAVGAPFGLPETVTAGIISAKSRGVGIAESEDFLQTDAAINPGNSGGPLVNLRGEVVGINTAISTRGGGSDGIGFAVPITLAKWVSEQLMETGTVQRAFLGVGIQQVTSDLSRQLGLTTVQGALVSDVQPDSAAAAAGLRPGDVVIRFNDQPVLTPRGLQNLVERATLDETHQIVIVRDGVEQTIEVTLHKRPDVVTTELSKPANDKQPQSSEFGNLGLDVSELSADVARQLGVSNVSGVVITNVVPGGAAERAGLEVGMVISRVGSQAVSSLEEFRAAVEEAELESGLLLLVQSQAGSRFIVLKSL
jgi:serine protease Do